MINQSIVGLDSTEQKVEMTLEAFKAMQHAEIMQAIIPVIYGVVIAIVLTAIGFATWIIKTNNKRVKEMHDIAKEEISGHNKEKEPWKMDVHNRLDNHEYLIKNVIEKLPDTLNELKDGISDVKVEIASIKGEMKAKK